MGMGGGRRSPPHGGPVHADEAEFIERVLRDHNGTVPDPLTGADNRAMNNLLAVALPLDHSNLPGSEKQLLFLLERALEIIRRESG